MDRGECVERTCQFVSKVLTYLRLTLHSQAYSLYLRTTKSSLVRQQSQLKTDIFQTKQELSRTSAQDQFAKWAKLRRSMDKNLSELEKLSAYPSPSSGLHLR